MRPITMLAVLVLAGFTADAALAQRAPAHRQSQNSAFCLQRNDGSMNCGYRTMAQCDASRKGSTGHCVANPAHSTTGSGSSSTGMQPRTSGSKSQPAK